MTITLTGISEKVFKVMPEARAGANHPEPRDQGSSRSKRAEGLHDGPKGPHMAERSAFCKGRVTPSDEQRRSPENWVKM